jgi:hypothetical protein
MPRSSRNAAYTDAASPCALPLKGRLIRAFLRAEVGALKAGRALVGGSHWNVIDLIGEALPPRAFAGFGGGPVPSCWTPPCEWRSSNARYRTGRSDEEMVPNGQAALGIQAVCVQPLQSGSERPLSQRAVPNIFPAPASSDERAFLPMTGGGLHDVAMGDQGSVPNGTARGILWPGGRALHIFGALIARCRGFRCRYFDTVWATLGGRCGCCRNL